MVCGQTLRQVVAQLELELLRPCQYQPDINQLDVRCGGQLVRDGHVESVHDQHGRDGHGHICLEVLLVEVESCLADDHQAQRGDLDRGVLG